MDRRTEITFDFDFMRESKNYIALTDEQTEQLKKWELECEYETSIPYPEKIQQVKDLIEHRGKTVVLIQRYVIYQKNFIKNAAYARRSPILGELPLLPSSDYGTQQEQQKLFFDVYHAVEYSVW